MSSTSFYSRDELAKLGLASFGHNVLLSRKTSIYSPESIHLGNDVRIDDFCILSGNLKIGSYIHIAAYCGLFGSEGITMEDFTGLSSRISIYTVSEDYAGNGMTNPMVPERYRRPVKGAVILEKHVIVGAGSVILPKVRIGTGSAVGAFSLVASDCDPWKIYVGVPAKIKRDRKSDVILAQEKDFLEGKKTNG